MNLHISTTEENRQLVECLRRGGSSSSRQLGPLPDHYQYAGKPNESFIDHIEKLKALKCMQQLTNNEFVRCIKGSLKDQALRVASSVDEEEFIDKLHGDRGYIEKLEKLFISSQQGRSYRLDFANVRQKQHETITEFYANLLYLAKAAKVANVDKSDVAKDQFVKGLRSNTIKKQLLFAEKGGETLNELMIRASNIDSIERNLTRPTTSSTDNTTSEPMEIGSMEAYNNVPFARAMPPMRGYPPATRPTMNGRFPIANAFGRGYPGYSAYWPRQFQGQQWNTYRPAYNNRPPGYARSMPPVRPPQMPYRQGNQNQFTSSRCRGRPQQSWNSYSRQQFDNNQHYPRQGYPYGQFRPPTTWSDKDPKQAKSKFAVQTLEGEEGAETPALEGETKTNDDGMVGD